MYHFTLIDEASTQNEMIKTDLQEEQLNNTFEETAAKKNMIQKTAAFLYRYLDQPNCVRIFISKN
jgi:hypothetical protein